MRLTLFIAVLCATAGAGCSGKSTASNPVSPSSTSTANAGATCRTYPTSADVSTTTLGVTQAAKLTGAFNSSTNQSTVTTQFANGTPCTTTVSSYRSTADFIDEIRVIPGVLLQAESTTAVAGACGSGTSIVTFAYDLQRRLTTVTSTGVAATTYTAWDSSGRPTTGSFAGTSISNVYNDAARTQTQTQTQAATGATSVTTTTFDANGAQLMVVNTTGGVVSTTTLTITSTQRVCK